MPSVLGPIHGTPYIGGSPPGVVTVDAAGLQQLVPVDHFLAGLSTGVLGITIDGGGSAITTGLKGFLRVPYACTITKATLLADQSGSAVVDIWKDSYANAPPTVADAITASAKPTLSTAAKSEDDTLTGWTKTIAAGDVLGFAVDSVATITRLTLILDVTKT